MFSFNHVFRNKELAKRITKYQGGHKLNNLVTYRSFPEYVYDPFTPRLDQGNEDVTSMMITCSICFKKTQDSYDLLTMEYFNGYFSLFDPLVIQHSDSTPNPTLHHFAACGDCLVSMERDSPHFAFRFNIAQPPVSYFMNFRILGNYLFSVASWYAMSYRSSKRIVDFDEPDVSTVMTRYDYDRHGYLISHVDVRTGTNEFDI